MARFLALFALAASASAVDYESLLAALWNQTDADGSGGLNVDEFKSALSDLGITVCSSTDTICTLRDHHNASALYSSLDGCVNRLQSQNPPCFGRNAELLPQELANALEFYPDYQDALIDAFTNGAGKAPDIKALLPSESLMEAKAIVSFLVTVAGAPESIYKGTRENIIAYFATSTGVDRSAVSITFLPDDESRRGRKLVSATTKISVRIFVADQAAADAAADALPQDAAALSAVPAFASVEVTSMSSPEPEARSQELPFTMMIAAAAVLFVAGLFLCCIATICSARKFESYKAGGKADQGTPAGCCKTGCCSYYALRSWAFGELTAAIAIIGSVYWLYTRFGTLTDGAVHLFEAVITLSASNVQATAEFRNMLPSEIINLLSEHIESFELLPLAVMVPGAVAALFLIFSALCSASTRRKGSYCCSKTMMMLATVFLVLCLIFYLICIVLALAISYPPQQLAVPINLIQGMCITVPANLNQMLSDNIAVVAQLESAGQDMAEARVQLASLTEVVGSVTGGCSATDEIFEGVYEIFLPGLICVIAIIYAFWVNEMLCCSAGCCTYKGPPTTVAKPPSFVQSSSSAASASSSSGTSTKDEMIAV